MAEDIKDKFESISTRVFTVKNCPEPVFESFVTYCEENAMDGNYPVYHLGLRRLLEENKNMKEQYMKMEMLYEFLLALQTRVDGLEEALQKPKQAEAKPGAVFDTMGGKKVFGGK